MSRYWHRYHGGQFVRSKSYDPLRFRAIGLANLDQFHQVDAISEADLFAMRVVAHVLPFRTNNYVVNNLIDWSRVPNDPMYQLTFPQKGMLSPAHFEKMASTLRSGSSSKEVQRVANEIRSELNPDPSSQSNNVPVIGTDPISGLQHKYTQTVLFFPSQGQTCHAYCTFCFRWPQFVDSDQMKFGTPEVNGLLEYLSEHPEVSDVLFTGGDPMIMKTRVLASYLEPLMSGEIPNISNIRIGSKALSYWPQRFTEDRDAPELLDLFRSVGDAGIQLAFMAHVNHPVELSTPSVEAAIEAIRSTGAVIRTQSAVMRYINDSPVAWADLWRRQVALGCIPYYMFVARDTGARDYFAIPLERAFEIFREATKMVGGLARTVRGPSMSTDHGKIQILGIEQIAGQKVFVLRFLQGRNPDWILRPFLARFNPDAVWIDDLKPVAPDSHFFFERQEETRLHFGNRRENTEPSSSIDLTEIVPP